MFVEKP